MEDLTKQEKIILALMRGLHLEKKELKIAEQQVHILNIHLKNRVNQ